MKVQFSKFAAERSFRSPLDFARFAEQQSEEFSALESNYPLAWNWWGKSAAQSWRSIANTAREENIGGEEITTAMKSHPAFPYKSELTRTLLAMTAQGRSAGVQDVFAYLKGSRENQSAHSVHIGHLTAHSEFAVALKLDQYSERKKSTPIDEWVADAESRIDEMLEADRGEIEQKRSQFLSMLEEAEQRHKELFGIAEKLIADSRAAWQETHNDFVEQLATETAVKLWRGRARSHSIRYRSFRKWAAGFGIIGFIITILWIFAGFGFAKLVFETDPTAQIASYTAGSLALFTLFVWGLRVLIRSMMSEDHLSTDASARSALAHTYLALTKDQAATPEDRAIILASLFAPVSDGLVKDDGMPALSPTAMAAQILTNPR